MSQDVLVDIALPVVIAIAYIALFIKKGKPFWYTFVPAMVVAVPCYFLTSYHHTPAPAHVLPIYLVALTVQFLHMGEEFATGFYWRWPEQIFHSPPMTETEHVVINMVSYAVFTIGALGIWYEIKWLMIIVWFVTLMGVVGNAIQHPIYCLKVRGYFPGIYTSLLYWIVAPILVVRLWNG
jgi:hypothetical protein